MPFRKQMGSYIDGFYCWIATDGKETRLDFCIVDTLTKSAHFIPVRTTYHAPDIARVFISEIVRLHGMPKKIISDRGSVFTR
jgi:hypothetical protein